MDAATEEFALKNYSKKMKTIYKDRRVPQHAVFSAGAPLGKAH